MRAVTLLDERRRRQAASIAKAAPLYKQPTTFNTEWSSENTKACVRLSKQCKSAARVCQYIQFQAKQGEVTNAVTGERAQDTVHGHTVCPRCRSKGTMFSDAATNKCNACGLTEMRNSVLTIGTMHGERQQRTNGPGAAAVGAALLQGGAVVAGRRRRRRGGPSTPAQRRLAFRKKLAEVAASPPGHLPAGRSGNAAKQAAQAVQAADKLDVVCEAVMGELYRVGLRSSVDVTHKVVGKALTCLRRERKEALKRVECEEMLPNGTPPKEVFSKSKTLVAEVTERLSGVPRPHFTALDEEQAYALYAAIQSAYLDVLPDYKRMEADKKAQKKAKRARGRHGVDQEGHDATPPQPPPPPPPPPPADKEPKPYQQHQVLLYRIGLMLGWDELLYTYFAPFDMESKVKKFDELYEMICNHPSLQWEFKPSVMLMHAKQAAVRYERRVRDALEALPPT